RSVAAIAPFESGAVRLAVGAVRMRQRIPVALRVLDPNKYPAMRAAALAEIDALWIRRRHGHRLHDLTDKIREAEAHRVLVIRRLLDQRGMSLRELLPNEFRLLLRQPPAFAPITLAQAIILCLPSENPLHNP